MKFVSRLVVLAGILFSAHHGQSQCIVINEIMIDPSGPNDGQNSPNTSEWIEFYNTCSTPVDISCYSFTDGDFSVVFPPGTIMQPYSFYVVGSHNSNAVINLNWATCNCATENAVNQIGVFGNSNEQVILHNNFGVVQDAITWGVGQTFNPITTSTNSGCQARSFSYSLAEISAFTENVGAVGASDCSLARACDGSTTWHEKCGTLATPGTSNGGAAPNVTFLASQTDICVGGCVNFSYTGNGNPTQYSWTFEGSSTATSISSSPNGICYPTAGDYDVTLTVTNACGTFPVTVADYIHVSANANVTITANGPTTFCTGGSVALQTTTAGPYQWYSGTNAISGATSQTYTATQAGSYSVTTTGSCGGASNAIEVSVAASLQPVVSANGPANLCNNETVSLSVNGTFATYQWYSGANPIAGATSSTHTVNQTGNYSVLVTDQGCDGTSNVIQVNHTTVLPPPTPADFQICQGEETDFSVSDIYDSYQWFSGTNPIAGATWPSYSLEVNNTVEIFLQVTLNGCTVMNDGVLITSIPSPQVTITPSADVQVCQSSFTLTGTSSTGNYQWLNGGVPIPGATSSTYIVTADGDYSFISNSATGNCSRTSSEVTVILETALDVEITASALQACEGQSITLSIEGSYDNITWSTNSSTNSISVSASGLYTVTVNTGGCTATDEVSILFNAMPVVNAGNDTISDCDLGVVLVGTGTGTLIWTPDPSLNVTEGTSIAHATPSYTTYYTLTASIGSCVATDQVMVEADCRSVYIPNIFTPNGDGVNDFFKVDVRGAKHYHLRIFNRWGEMLFESTDPNKVWNGGKQDYYAPDGVYFWTLELLDYQSQPMLGDGTSHGHVTLVR